MKKEICANSVMCTDQTYTRRFQASASHMLGCLSLFPVS